MTVFFDEYMTHHTNQWIKDTTMVWGPQKRNWREKKRRKEETERDGGCMQRKQRNEGKAKKKHEESKKKKKTERNQKRWCHYCSPGSRPVEWEKLRSNLPSPWSVLDERGRFLSARREKVEKGQRHRLFWFTRWKILDTGDVINMLVDEILAAFYYFSNAP